MKANQGGLAQLIATSENIYMCSAAATLRLDQTLVHCDTTTAAFALTLPPVNEAAGMIFAVRLAAGATNAVTLQDQNESEDWTDLTLDASEDQVVLFSNGIAWNVLFNGIA